METKDLETWLNAVNRDFRAQAVPQRKRPWAALQRLATERGLVVPLGSAISDAVFEWFKGRSKEGVNEVGSVHETLFFFDEEFWAIEIPIIWGEVSLDPFECLKGMPLPLLNDLQSSPFEEVSYVRYWADCMDYGYGISEILDRPELDGFGRSLLTAAHFEVKATVSQLKEKRPEARAILSARNATEIFFKAFVALQVGLTDKEAKVIGHDLKAGLQAALKAGISDELLDIENELDVFPPISDRYEEQKASPSEVWRCLELAQYVGATVARAFSSRNMRGQVQDDLDV